jgi:hypothetical protein
MDKAQLEALRPYGPSVEQRAAIRASGWKISEGFPAPGGFRRAKDGGGYVTKVTPATEVVQITTGCPGYHADVAWR